MLEFLLVIIYLNTLLIFILANLTIYVKKNLNVNFIIAIWNGKRTNINKYYGKYVRIIQVINYAKYFRINFIRNGKAYYADSRDKTLFYSIHRLNHFPINFKITKYDWRIYAKNRKEKVKPQT